MLTKRLCQRGVIDNQRCRQIPKASTKQQRKETREFDPVDLWKMRTGTTDHLHHIDPEARERRQRISDGTQRSTPGYSQGSFAMKQRFELPRSKFANAHRE